MAQAALTKQIRSILGYARDHAASLGHELIEPEHLLMGLLDVGRCAASWMITDLGVNSDLLLSAIKADAFPAPAGSIDRPYSPRAKEVLDLAIQHAASMGHDSVGSSHLLLALVIESESLAAKALASQGVTAERAGQLFRSSSWDDERTENTSDPSQNRDASRQSSEPDLISGFAHYEMNENALAVVADLDAVPTAMIVELMAALDAVHRARGGAGLRIDAEQVGVALGAGTLV